MQVLFNINQNGWFWEVIYHFLYHITFSLIWIDEVSLFSQINHQELQTLYYNQI
jgi:hypothetical protein